MAICPKCGERETYRYYAYCKECGNAYKREYRATNKEKVLEYSREYRADPVVKAKEVARSAAYKAFPKPQPCEECGCTEHVERHHEDYDKPLEIRWLCRSCHTKHHLNA